MKDIKDLSELIKDLDGGQTRFNTRTTELLRKSMIHLRDATMTRHVAETALLASIRTICAREFKQPYDYPFFSTTYEEDFKPLGFSHDDALLEMFRQACADDYMTDEDIIKVMCHG